ncbi:helix-turn-helix domain-containing protein [Actinophytocola algeriensis]|uniref:Transcriptional regulator with XRE-family HTH domain n=1 Tax=Actinophytocola algeriensis TaxID=1768010 RepID=A0A7W7QCF6_9PSEU|nr:helix-turn-helix transcriptional regulator [Actinophytocola algeriensis]MBB4910571.1 transcriptional regulator with XRE-family HTH domain [Actinophytocola algeriensis]MBE1480440.1 transcriptional regulator with XRE-family HTH domain [Actinophytocola algeriensis]
MAHDATKRRLQLGIELEKAREGANMTQQRVAAALGCTQSKINKIEIDTVVVSVQDLNDLLRLYAPSKAQEERIRLLAAQSMAGPSAGAAANREYLKLLALEREAVEVLAFYSERIPNLLQSEMYMLEQYQLTDQLYDVNSITESRLEREELFTIPRPPRYRVVFSVSSFYRMPGGRTARLAVDQIEHLLRMMDTYRKRLFVHVLPWEANLPYIPHDLTVLRFDDPTNDQLYHEYGEGEGRIYTGRKQVSAHIKYWEKAYAQALSVDDTRKFLRDLIEEARSW